MTIAALPLVLNPRSPRSDCARRRCKIPLTLPRHGRIRTGTPSNKRWRLNGRSTGPLRRIHEGLTVRRCATELPSRRPGAFFVATEGTVLRRPASATVARRPASQGAIGRRPKLSFGVVRRPASGVRRPNSSDKNELAKTKAARCVIPLQGLVFETCHFANEFVIQYWPEHCVGRKYGRSGALGHHRRVTGPGRRSQRRSVDAAAAIDGTSEAADSCHCTAPARTSYRPRDAVAPSRRSPLLRISSAP